MYRLKKITACLTALALIAGCVCVGAVHIAAAEPGSYEIDSKVQSMMQSYNANYEELSPKIEQNIEKYRKGDAEITVVDKDGNTVPNAVVNVEQVSHGFDFGCNGLMLGQYDSEQKNQKYEQLFTRLFNTVTTTMCFEVYGDGDNDYNFDYSEFRRPAPTAVEKFAQHYGLKIKGQPLMADSWNPEWAAKDETTLKSQYVNWFKAVNARFGKSFGIFDIINETQMWKSRTPDFPMYTSDLSNVDWAFTQAQSIFGDNVTLEINDSISFATGYYDLVKRLSSKRLIDSIGLQYHLFSSDDALNHLNNQKYALKDIYNTYNKFSDLGNKMYISEITIPTNLSGCTIQQGQAIQAEVLKRLYRLWFSIPNMNGIIYWNFVDGAAWGTEGDLLGCLVDSEFNPKPAYYVLDNLINNEWITKTSCVSAANGIAEFRGFHGDYIISVTTQNGVTQKKITLSPNSANQYTIKLDSEPAIQPEPTGAAPSTNAAPVESDPVYCNTAEMSNPFFWKAGHYDTYGTFAEFQNRICVRKLIRVTAGQSYKMTLNTDNPNCKYVIREYNSTGHFTKSYGVLENGAVYTPSSGTGAISVSVYIKDDQTTSLKRMISSGSLSPAMIAVGAPQSTEPNTAATQGTVGTTAQISSNLFDMGGGWIAGQYMQTDGGYNNTYPVSLQRVCLKKKIAVVPGAQYSLDTGFSGDTYKLVIRGYDAQGKFVVVPPTIFAHETMTIPEGVASISATIYKPNDTAITSSDLLTLLDEKALNPSMSAVAQTTTSFTQTTTITTTAPTTITTTTIPTTTIPTTTISTTTIPTPVVTIPPTTPVFVLYGDVNSDKAVNAKDILRLKQYLADWKVDIHPSASDVNKDDAVNAKDLLLIRKHLANWDVILGA